MRGFLILAGWIIVLFTIGSFIAIIGTSQSVQRNADIYLEPHQKVLSVDVDENHRLFVTTRTMKDEESPDVIRVYLYPGKVSWIIHESK